MPLQQSKQRKTNMKVKPIKIKIKQPTPTAADRLYAKHQAIRKEKGLPDPSEYKKKLDGMKSEEVELDEMDKSAPQPGRDGSISHKTYGSRETIVTGKQIDTVTSEEGVPLVGEPFTWGAQRGRRESVAATV